MPRHTYSHRPALVLLADDDPLVRMLQAEILQEAKFHVVEAQSADQAFEILRRRPDVDIVVTDVQMPGSINGFEFARLIAQGWPEIGVLVVSGMTAPKPGDLPDKALFARKPVKPADLVERVRVALEQATGSRSVGTSY